MWNVINNAHTRMQIHGETDECTLRVDMKYPVYNFFSQDSEWPEVRVNETIRMSCFACIKCRGERMPRLKGLRFWDCSQYEIARHRERDMGREAACPQVYALRRSGGELPWPLKRIVALAKRVTLTVPRGGILHGAHFEEGQVDERWRTRLEGRKLRTIVFGLFAHISYPDCLPYSSVSHFRVSCTAFSFSLSHSLISKDFVGQFRPEYSAT